MANNQNIIDLENKRIGPLLAKLSIPTTIGMLANSLSIILSLTRQVLYLLPLILFLPLLWGVNGIWMAFPVADLLAIITTGIFLYRELKKINKLELEFRFSSLLPDNSQNNHYN